MNQAPNTDAPPYPKSLVLSEAASSLLSLAGTETGRRTFPGNVEKYESGVDLDTTNAHITLHDGIASVAALLNDAPCNEV